MEKYERLSSLFQSNNKVMKMKTTAITIKAGTSFELPVMVSKPGTTVHWVFHTKGYDIRFGIARGRPGSNREFLVANTTYAPDSPQQGKVVFPDAGDYFLVWDNTYSWIREKNVVYSVDIILPDLTLDEQVECAKTIMTDVEGMKKAIETCHMKEAETKNQLADLEKERQSKCDELERLKQEIIGIEETMKERETVLTDLNQQVDQEKNMIDLLVHSAPFLLEGDRIISMLTAPDLLRLGCVNKLLHEAVNRESVWLRSFKQDSKEDLEIVLKNEWLMKKWSLVYPGMSLAEKKGNVNTDVNIENNQGTEVEEHVTGEAKSSPEISE